VVPHDGRARSVLRSWCDEGGRNRPGTRRTAGGVRVLRRRSHRRRGWHVGRRGARDGGSGGRIPNTLETRFAIASATKGATALVVVSLIVDEILALETAARSLLGRDLPLIDDAVTVGHLLAHRSGIGDYLDEDAMESIADYVMPVPVHHLDSAEASLAVLDGHPQSFPPGERFRYNNGAFVVLALLAERAAGVPYAELVRARVTEPAGMADTSFVRSDEVPGGVAKGYLNVTGLRTNVLHIPWEAMFAGRILPPEWVARITSPSGDFSAGERRYGLGFWLNPKVPPRSWRATTPESPSGPNTTRPPADPGRWSPIRQTAPGRSRAASSRSSPTRRDDGGTPAIDQGGIRWA